MRFHSSITSALAGWVFRKDRLKYYHEQRAYRGIGRDNTVLDEGFVPKTEGRVRCKSELGGILKSYYREAA